MSDVGHAPGALPLLQYALTELAEAAEDGVLSLASYREVGGVAGALLQRADGLHERSTPAERAITRQVLLQLVDPSDTGAVLRRRVRQDELVQRTDDPETAAGVVTAYGAARLLAFDRDPSSRAPTVEVAHEALLQQWSVLRDWLEEAHDDLRAAQRWATAAREWDETGREASFLATGARLVALEQWAARAPAGVGTLERTYLAASLRAREDDEAHEQARAGALRAAQRREVRRLRAVAGVLAVAVAAAAALAVFGLGQQDRAERAAALSDARAVAADAAASVTEDPERAVLLALQAVAATRTPDGSALPTAVETLHRAVVADRIGLTLQGTGGAADWAGRAARHRGPRGQRAGRGPQGDRRARAGLARARRRQRDRLQPDGRRLLIEPATTAPRDCGTSARPPAVGGGVHRPGLGSSFDRTGRLASAAWQDEGVVRVLDTATGAVRGVVRAVERPEASALLPDGSRVVVAGRRASGALVADARTGAPVRHLDGDGARTLDLALSPDGRRVATARVGGGTVLWDLADGRARGTLLGGALVADLDWSPDGSRVVVGGDDGVARVLALEDGALHEVLRLTSSQLRGVTGVAFSPTGQQVLLGDGRTTRSQVWDVTDAGSREWLTLAAPPERAVGADFAGSGDRLVASAPGGTAAVVEVASGRVLRRTPPQPGVVTGVRVSPDGRRVAGVAGGALRVWDVDTAAEVVATPAPTALGPPQWRRDGRQLALVTDRGLLLVDVPTGDVVVPTRPDVVAAAYTPDGQRLVTAHSAATGRRGGRVDVHDVATWRLTDHWTADVVALAVTPDGRSVVGALTDGDVVVRDLATGATTAELVGHVGRVLDLAMSPDGTLLASAGRDGSVRLWELASQTQVLQLPGHDSAVATVRWSRDGRRLVTSSWDGTVRVWAVALDDLVELRPQPAQPRADRRRVRPLPAATAVCAGRLTCGARSRPARSRRRPGGGCSVLGSRGPTPPPPFEEDPMSVLTKPRTLRRTPVVPAPRPATHDGGAPVPTSRRVRQQDDQGSRRRRAALVLAALVAAIAAGTATAVVQLTGDDATPPAPGQGGVTSQRGTSARHHPRRDAAAPSARLGRLPRLGRGRGRGALTPRPEDPAARRTGRTVLRAAAAVPRTAVRGPVPAQPVMAPWAAEPTSLAYLPSTPVV